MKERFTSNGDCFVTFESNDKDIEKNYRCACGVIPQVGDSGYIHPEDGDFCCSKPCYDKLSDQVTAAWNEQPW